MENDNVITLLTTDLNSFKDKALIFFETRIGGGKLTKDLDPKKREILRIGRAVIHTIYNGVIYREFNPSLKILNNITAEILQFKRKDKNNDTSERGEEGTDLRDEQSRDQDGEEQ